jgi:hypothetical protein
MLSKPIFLVLQIFLLFITAHGLRLTAYCQKIAVLTPEENAHSVRFTEKLTNSLSAKFKVLDKDLSGAAFLSVNPQKPFNLTVQDSKLIGEAIGCQYFLLVNAFNQRRYSFELRDHFESYAIIYAVSSRTGKLIYWTLKTFNGFTPENAEKLLLDSTENLTTELHQKLSANTKTELNEKALPNFTEIPPETVPNFRPPLPYKRISPPYTEIAAFYKAEATVDIEVYVDESGKIVRTEIVRWAGFGLDESVAETIRKMNWRPAEKNGEKVPIRALLRYNFKKIEKEE